MTQKDYKKITIKHKYNDQEDFNLSNRSIFERFCTSNKVLIAESLIDEIRCFFEANGVSVVFLDYEPWTTDYPWLTYLNISHMRDFRNYCAYVREYISYWMHDELMSEALKDYELIDRRNINEKD